MASGKILVGVALEARRFGGIERIYGACHGVRGNLPARIKTKAALNTPNQDTFYTPDTKGYTDYPALEAA